MFCCPEKVGETIKSKEGLMIAIANNHWLKDYAFQILNWLINTRYKEAITYKLYVVICHGFPKLLIGLVPIIPFLSLCIFVSLSKDWISMGKNQT